MGNHGPKPKRKVRIKWSQNFAYAIGLIATDGCLSSDGRHIEFTSKDKQQVQNMISCLGLSNKIGMKYSGEGKRSFRVQFGDVLFYQFLLGIGLTPNKSKTIGRLEIPKRYFFDYLRGAYDGDGSFYSYKDVRWKSSTMYYLVFSSASISHVEWMRNFLKRRIGVWGHVTHNYEKSVYQLKYAKTESLKILKKMYDADKVVCLGRKRLKIKRILAKTEWRPK